VGVGETGSLGGELVEMGGGDLGVRVEAMQIAEAEIIGVEYYDVRPRGQGGRGEN
jgi:hypothetical protein